MRSSSFPFAGRRATSAALALLAWLSAGGAAAQAPQPEAQAPQAVVQPAVGKGQRLKAAMLEQASADKAAAVSQAAIDRMQDETQDMAGKYHQALVDKESIRKYTEQLSVQVKSQTDRMGEMQKQLSEIEATQRDVLPLMQKMIETLEQFVALDVPFLIGERTKRVATLKEMMGRADVSTSEKYRRILEAYQIEMEYGRTLDAYPGKLGEGEAAKTVQFVRLGRISLMYQTLDGRETGYWDAQKKGWIEDSGYARDVKKVLSVAKKEGAPDLVMVPVSAPTEVKP